MSAKILVFQSRDGGLYVCKKILSSLGLTESKDYIASTNHKEALGHLEANERQLLITGSFGGSDEGVAEMLSEAKERNPELAVVAFSLDNLPGPVDLWIGKSGRDFGMSLKAAIQSFLDGTLKRVA